MLCVAMISAAGGSGIGNGIGSGGGSGGSTGGSSRRRRRSRISSSSSEGPHVGFTFLCFFQHSMASEGISDGRRTCRVLREGARGRHSK